MPDSTDARVGGGGKRAEARGRVLVVDDEAPIRLFLSRELADAGYEAREASSAEEAWRLLAREKIDLVMTDIRMPGADGLDFSEWARQDHPGVDIIVMTGFASVESAVRAVRFGAFDFLQKPFGEIGRIRRAVDRVFEKRELEAEKRRLEAELSESRDNFHAIVERSSDGIVVVEAGGRILYANSAAEALLGAISLEMPEKLRSIDLAAGAASEFESQRPDGTKGIAEARVDLTSWQGSPALVAVFRDVTERRRLEESLRQALKMEAVGQLAGGVAHDFNNLLTVILAYSDLVLRGRESDKKLVEDMAQVKETARRAAFLTRQLLAFSRKQATRPVPLDLDSAIESLEKMLRRLIPANIEMARKSAPGIPQVLADPDEIVQIVMNLVVNARDAMPEGGRLEIETDVAATAPGKGRSDSRRWVLLSISDTGMGIPPEVRRRLFEPFFTTKELGKGTGLGLATVKSIVERSGGSIEVESEPGKGSTFRIYFPAIEGKAAASPTGVPVAPAPVREARGTILLVEDEEALRGITQRALENAGYRVLSAANPELALAAVRAPDLAIDLVLSDLVMPGMSGLELVRGLRTRWPRVRVLFMSGYGEDALPELRRLPAEFPFLAKPFPVEFLLERVRQAIGS